MLGLRAHCSQGLRMTFLFFVYAVLVCFARQSVLIAVERL